MGKTKTITLQFGYFATTGGVNSGAPNYRVHKVTDSTEFNPGQVLEKKQVDELCSLRSWKVTVQGSQP